jgi:hypothetical protein
MLPGVSGLGTELPEYVADAGEPKPPVNEIVGKLV